MTRGIRLIAFTKAPDSTNYTGIESFDGFETRIQFKGITYRNKWLPHLWILFQNCTPHNIHVCPLTGMNTKIAKINSILAPKRPRALKCSPATGFFSYFFPPIFHRSKLCFLENLFLINYSRNWKTFSAIFLLQTIIAVHTRLWLATKLFFLCFIKNFSNIFAIILHKTLSFFTSAKRRHRNGAPSVKKNSLRS